MKSYVKWGLALLFVPLAVTVSFAFRNAGIFNTAPPKLPANVVGSAVHLLHAQPFTVDRPYIHTWRKEKPWVRDGYLLVLEADRALLYRRQVPEPVLYVGAQVAERVNSGAQSGRAVVLVPGDFDLAQAPIFFGPPGIPEELDGAAIGQQLRAALNRGVGPIGSAQLKKVLHPAIRAADHYHLRLLAADLIERYSPDEVDLVQGMRVPLIGGN